jgi:hypothetical protein
MYRLTNTPSRLAAISPGPVWRLKGNSPRESARFWGTKPSEELYDLDADPDNMINLVQVPTLRPTLERMRQALQQHTVEINDNGFLPEGSRIEGYEASREAGAFSHRTGVRAGDPRIRPRSQEPSRPDRGAR